MPKHAAPLTVTVDLLRDLTIFKEASAADLAALASSAEERSYPPRTDVIREGRIPTHLYAVRSGTLEVWSTGESGEARKINTLTEGDHFGEIGLIEGMPSTATVRTATDCVLLRVPAADFLRVVSDAPHLMQPLLERVAGGLARSHPSYRLAAEEAGKTSAADLLGETRARLTQLSPEERRRFLDGLKTLVAEGESLESGATPE
ncbi:MAG TPA: cyclic nucleotide-binding domain-containing protein [Actinomycetota bacterium]|nr:cyclic nucleotide-binding domain-containing protein [Actinomycetota bacterium]